jgi:transcriptional regulator with XRE-family HTH domain
MTGSQLYAARVGKGWTQVRTCAALHVSQPYLSLMERSLREVPDAVARRAAKVFNMPAETLSLRDHTNDKDWPQALAALGYPGYAYLRGRKQNPASLLLSALSQDNLERRVVEALPWVVMDHPNMDWEWLVREMKLRDLQNRLGYVTGLAAKKTRDVAARNQLLKQQLKLEHARLVREDTLCHASMTQAERRWLRAQRPAEAEHWNLLTDLAVEHLPYE